MHRLSRTRRLLMTAALGSVVLVGSSVGSPAQADTRHAGAASERAVHRGISVAVWCGAANAPTECFEHTTGKFLARIVAEVDQLKGTGARGTDQPRFHCYDGDSVPSDPAYPRSLSAAQRSLRECVTAYQLNMTKAVGAASHLLTGPKGRLRAIEADLTRGYKYRYQDLCGFPTIRSNAKCQVLLYLGKALSVAEDFYLNTNWADVAAPGPTTLANPPGLGLTSPAAFLTGPTAGDVALPEGLISGCEPGGGDGPCRGRIRATNLDKDRGDIDWRTGKATQPGTPRGKVSKDGVTNFERAVEVARAQVRASWSYFMQKLKAAYGEPKAAKMIDAITDDTPYAPCRSVGGSSKSAQSSPSRPTDAKRTVEITLDNRTSRTLRCDALVLDDGEWTNYPERRVGPGGESEWRTQSRGDWRGTEGSVRYSLDGTGDQVTIHWDNPLAPWSSNTMRCRVPASFTCSVTGGSGTDAKVRVVVGQAS